MKRAKEKNSLLEPLIKLRSAGKYLAVVVGAIIVPQAFELRVIRLWFPSVTISKILVTWPKLNPWQWSTKQVNKPLWFNPSYTWSAVSFMINKELYFFERSFCSYPAVEPICFKKVVHSSLFLLDAKDDVLIFNFGSISAAFKWHTNCSFLQIQWLDERCARLSTFDRFASFKISVRTRAIMTLGENHWAGNFWVMEQETICTIKCTSDLN